MKTLFASFIVTGLILAGAAGWTARKDKDKDTEPVTERRVAKVQRGDLSHTIIAPGTVKLEKVEVGAQLTGKIESFGCNPDDPNKVLDCGSPVKKGAILAKIDPTIYKAQVDYAEASLAKTKANLVQAQARYCQTEQDWKRAEGLLRVQAISDADVGTAAANFRMAEANVGVWEAAVRECEATLCIASTNLKYTTIVAPCNGIVLERRVNVGQTVVASFNAPGLFDIAKESEEMQVWASVDEADIGFIRINQPVRFTVNACFDRTFEGHVSQIRMNPVKRQDAITYTVVVSAKYCRDVLPDMTASLKFEVERLPNVLLLPNEVLDEAAESEAVADADAGKADAPSDPKTPATSQVSRAARLWKERKANRHLLVREGDMLRPIEVQLGASNGLVTEVSGSNVREGMEVVPEEVCMKDGR